MIWVGLPSPGLRKRGSWVGHGRIEVVTFFTFLCGETEACDCFWFELPEGEQVSFSSHRPYSCALLRAEHSRHRDPLNHPAKAHSRHGDLQSAWEETGSKRVVTCLG